MMVITIMSIVKNLSKYIGFTFMGLMLFKLSIMFLVMNKLHLSEVPYHKYHFIPPYLVSLLLETLFAIGLLKEQKITNSYFVNLFFYHIFAKLLK